MAKIEVLDKNMINMIAAGEVIERPASVVKEMLENSIDAGAKKVTVNIEDGGKKLITVTDNGCGITAEDIPTAFEPHATSKIKTVDDLKAIKSMGFRGEALASIGSVANVKITSRPADSIEAATMEIDFGDKNSVSPASSDYGTTIEVRDLFYKLPARRKFLRTSNTEMGHITEHFIRIALANTDRELTLVHNGRKIHQLLETQNFADRIAQLFSRQIAEDLISVATEEKGIKINAFIGKPVASRSNNKYQYTFLNGRYIRDKFVTHALKEAYRGLIEPNKYPVAFIFIEMPYDNYDVNVHPTKVEIRFDNPNLLHSVVLGVLREKLLGMDLDINATLPQTQDAPSLIAEPNTEDSQRKERIREAMANFFKDNKPSTQQSLNFGSSQNVSSRPTHGSGFSSANKQFSGSSQFSASKNNFGEPTGGSFDSFSGQNSAAALSPRRAYNEFDNGPSGETATVSQTEQNDTDSSNQNNTRKLIQLHNSYIVAETEEGFMLIDQHALHERIIYEKLCDRIFGNNQPLESQRLLIPETVEVNPIQVDAINDNLETFKKLGIEIEPFGPKTFAIHSFPIILKKAAPAEFVEGMLDIITDSAGKIDPEKLIHEVLDMASCKAAIKAGNPLLYDEMLHLIEQKDRTQRSSRCPHGRPTTIKFTLGEIEKQFKRTGF